MAIITSHQFFTHCGKKESDPLFLDDSVYSPLQVLSQKLLREHSKRPPQGRFGTMAVAHAQQGECEAQAATFVSWARSRPELRRRQNYI
jgi:hypothetical protein